MYFFGNKALLEEKLLKNSRYMYIFVCTYEHALYRKMRIMHALAPGHAFEVVTPTLIWAFNPYEYMR